MIINKAAEIVAIYKKAIDANYNAAESFDSAVDEVFPSYFDKDAPAPSAAAIAAVEMAKEIASHIK